MSRKMPSVEVNNYTSIFTSPIFKDQNGEWYRDVGYEDSLDIIRDNFHGVRKSFVAIGYYLKHIREHELYKEGNYQNIWECAKEEFGLSQPAASNYMQMNDAFSVNGNTPLLDEKYAGFNKSQLQEMLALPDEIKEEMKPDQTVVEIRKIAKEEKKVKEPSEAEIKKFYDIHAKNYDDDRSKLKELLIQYLGKRHSSGNSGGLNYQCSPRGVKIEKAEEITWAHLIKLINLYISPKVKQQPEPENIAEQGSTIEQQLPGQMNVQDYLEDNANTKDESPQIELSKTIVEGFPCDDCSYDVVGCCNYLDTSDDYCVMGNKKLSTRENVVQPDKDTEFPLLKNSEQHKAWLAAYKSWGLWYRDEHIDVNYYKFDFPEGSRLIVAEYPQRPSNWERKCYDHYYFHLLEKNKPLYGSNGTYDEKYQNSTDSETYLVDFLKNVQKCT